MWRVISHLSIFTTMGVEIKAKTTVDDAEVEQFSRIAGEWWSPRGKFKPLHDISALRLGWIVKQVGKVGGVRLLDIGCGGGLVCEPMARLGASVTGIDASEKNIEVAKLHAQQSGFDIDYRCTTAEELVTSLRGAAGDDQARAIQPGSLPPQQVRGRDDGFDVVLALEIIEHVADVGLFVESVCRLAKPGGLVIFSTISRTMKSYALAIVSAEYVLRMLPRGTHQWEKFLKPSELAAHLRANNIEITEMTGMTLNPLQRKWELNPQDLGVNYLVAGKKALS